MSHIIETATNPIGLKKSMATLRKNYSVPVCLTHMPELFYEYYRNEILSKHPEAGKGNEALARLEEAGYLKTIITKGIYNMPQKAGCKNVINMYGNIYENNACPRCGKIFPD